MSRAESSEAAIVEAILEHGVDVNAIATKIWESRTSMSSPTFTNTKPIMPIIVAVNESIDPAVVELMLDRGVDVNIADGDSGNTLLHLGSRHPGITSLLIDRGANIEAHNNEGDSPLSFRCFQEAFFGRASGRVGADSLATIEVLLARGANIEAKDEHGKTPLVNATGFHVYPELIGLLLEWGADPGAHSDDGWTPLHFAVREVGQSDRAIASVRMLLDAGVNVNARNDSATTPLHFAITAQFPNLAMASLLLDRGADVNAKDNDGRTPLHAAIVERFSEHKSLGVGHDPDQVSLLLAGGADTKAEDNQGKAPCQYARLRGVFIGEPVLKSLCSG